ncbi:hypothetical protein [Arthrobacter celericrescens]|uniref:hypothetical protein n=1 Tax=Arthrobacter celericrescens TaxID=2320851 RepID=UPI000EA2411E|nr:hypothetical protein [Arthrobacter celericrescens]
MKLTKQFLITGSIMAGAGLLVAAGFLVASGIDYRIAEDTGVQPGYTPEWIMNGMTAGFLLAGLGALVAIAGGVLALRRSIRLTNRFLIAGCIAAGLGVLVAGGSLVALLSGYGMTEDAGIHMPQWFLNGMTAGILLIGLGAAAAITGGALARRHPPRPIS